MPNLTPTANFMNGERAPMGRASLFMAAQAGAAALPVCHSRIIKYNKAWSSTQSSINLKRADYRPTLCLTSSPPHSIITLLLLQVASLDPRTPSPSAVLSPLLPAESRAAPPPLEPSLSLFFFPPACSPAHSSLPFSICSTFARCLHPSLSLCLGLPFVFLCQLLAPLLLSSRSPAFTPSHFALCPKPDFPFSPFIPHCFHCQTSIILSIYPVLISFHTFLTVFPSLLLPPFTLSDGRIDSLFDDIAQGQARGRKPL